MTEIRSPLQFFQLDLWSGRYSPAFRPCLPSLQSRYGSDSDTPSVQLIEPLHGHPLGVADPRYDSSHPSPITTILFPLRRVTGVFAGEVPGCLPLMCVMICLWVPPQQDLCSNSFRSSHSLNTVLYKHNRNQSLAKKANKMTNVYLFKHFGWSLPSRWGNQLPGTGAHVPCSFGLLCDIE